MPLSEKQLTDLKEGLRRCSPETVEAAIRYRDRGDLSAIPTVVYGLIERYQPANSTTKLSEANDDTRLAEDLGLDSLTLLELVLSIEEVLNLRIDNEELKGIRNLGSLKKFLHNKLSGAPTTPTAKSYNRDHISLVLPQQYPFLFLDEAELSDEKVVAHYTVKGDEFFLPGHFKDEPVFPASILFESLGQAACLWLLEKAPQKLAIEIKSNHVYFAGLDGARVYRKTGPGARLTIEQKLVQLREPLAIFEGTVSLNGDRVAKIDRLMLAFGDQATAAGAIVATSPSQPA